MVTPFWPLSRQISPTDPQDPATIHDSWHWFQTDPYSPRQLHNQNPHTTAKHLLPYTQILNRKYTSSTGEIQTDPLQAAKLWYQPPNHSIFWKNIFQNHGINQEWHVSIVDNAVLCRIHACSWYRSWFRVSVVSFLVSRKYDLIMCKCRIVPGFQKTWSTYGGRT